MKPAQAFPTRQEVLACIGELLREECAVRGAIDPGSRLREDLALDSLGALTLAVGLENRFRIRLEEHGGELPRTVEELADHVRRRCAQAGHREAAS